MVVWQENQELRTTLSCRVTSKDSLLQTRRGGCQDGSVGKVLAVKPDNLSSSPGTRLVEGEFRFPQLF